MRPEVSPLPRLQKAREVVASSEAGKKKEGWDKEVNLLQRERLH